MLGFRTAFENNPGGGSQGWMYGSLYIVSFVVEAEMCKILTIIAIIPTLSNWSLYILLQTIYIKMSSPLLITLSFQEQIDVFTTKTILLGEITTVCEGRFA